MVEEFDDNGVRGELLETAETELAYRDRNGQFVDEETEP
jgi:hypothetical protein